MNRIAWITVLIAVLAAAAAGYLAGEHGSAMHDRASTSTAAPAKRKVLYWKAPMDPNFRSDKPGKSPMGMDLVPIYADTQNDSADVRISPSVVNNLGVRTATVQRGSMSDGIEAVGYVAYDDSTIASINTRADGWIEKLAVKSTGDRVRRGQVLYRLFSPKLATAQREYLTALDSHSKSLIAASRERMRALGFTAAQVSRLQRTRTISDRVARIAGADGVVMKLGISEGAYVMPATMVMKLADLKDVWVMLEVDEANAAMLHAGQAADVSFDAFPDRQWHGVVDYVYPDLNSMTRSVKARVRIANPDRRLQPNMFAHVALHAGTPRDSVYIPRLALIRTGHSDRVVVAHGGGRFDVCPVKLGSVGGEQAQILEGLRPGQRVVTSAQFLIDSEANIDAAALRLGSGKPGCAETPTGSPNGDVEGESGSMTVHAANSAATSMPTPTPPSKMKKTMSAAEMRNMKSPHAAGPGARSSAHDPSGPDRKQRP